MTAQKSQQEVVTFKVDEATKILDVLVGGKRFTTFRWTENLCKPVLYPIFTSGGVEITRGYPIDAHEGEQVDHPHQTGMWLTYGNVNGYDFWGNGSGGLGTKNKNGGVIKHLQIEKTTGGKGEGILVSKESWTDPSGKELLKEHTEYHFIARGPVRIIDRFTVLTATEQDVTMPDTKEGMFAIRVNRSLELPAKGEVSVFHAGGDPVKSKSTVMEGITGNYRSSEGVSGEAVWGTRAKWMLLYGMIGNEKVSVAIIDHPQSKGYPTHWHARGYGLFSANPLGLKDFSKGKQEMNLTIPAGKSVTFNYRVVISSGSHLTDAEINVLAGEFAANK